MDPHTIVTLVFGAVVGLIGIIYRNDQKAYERAQQELARVRAEDLARLIALEKQNTEQETRIATLVANSQSHNASTDRLDTAIEKLSTKIDALTYYLAGKRTPGEMPATKPQR